MKSHSDPVSHVQPVSCQDTVVGIDPGAHGAIVVLRAGQLVAVVDMPTEEVRVGSKMRTRVSAAGVVDLCVMLRRDAPAARIWIEQVNGGSRDGGGAAFVFGHSVGLLDGALYSHGLRPERVHPTVWKRVAGLSGSGKGASVDLAEARFTNHAGRFRGPRGGGLDGRAEAALIALYGASRG